MRSCILALSLLLTIPACSSTPPAAAASQGNGTFTSDSARARELAEFRVGLPEVTEFANGASSLDSLAREIVDGMIAGDRARLQPLVLSRGEFAWIYYPATPQARPPYDLDPSTMWMMLENQGARGLDRGIGRLDAKPVTYSGVRCEGTVSTEGENRVYGPCFVSVKGSVELAGEGRLFGLVVERHGRWKVLSYANNLD